MGIMDKLRRLWFYATTDPNSPKGLRHRAAKLIAEGFRPENPAVSYLVKQALLKEQRGDLIPSPAQWEAMSQPAKRKWIQNHLKEF